MAKRSAWRRFSDYIRHDFSEIVWPRSMPDPPGTKYITDLSFKQHVRVWRDALREYAASWRWYHGEPEEVKAKRRAEERAAREAEDLAARRSETDGYVSHPDDDDDNTTFKDEFGRMVRVGRQVGLQGWKQQIQHFYQTRGRAYRDAMREFVAGYKEGIRDAATPPSRSAMEDAERVPLEFEAKDFEQQQKQSTPTNSAAGGGGGGGGAGGGGGGAPRDSDDKVGR